jgi:hypothetical protein
VSTEPRPSSSTACATTVRMSHQGHDRVARAGRSRGEGANGRTPPARVELRKRGVGTPQVSVIYGGCVPPAGVGLF